MDNKTEPHSVASFGIDHPLIAVHDIDALRQRLINIGFNMTTIGKHPWGTSTSLAIFPNCLLEIMGIYDDSLLDEKPATNFRFGRHIYEHLQQREGVALTALHSTGSIEDAEHASACGFDVAGHLEFGRDVRLPNGAAERTRTTLALLPNTRHPRLSFFLCQQHRRDLVEVAQWMNHPNTVCGISGITIKAMPEHQREILDKLGSLYGESREINGGFSLDTPNGTINVFNSQTISQHLNEIPEQVLEDEQSAIIGMEFCCGDLIELERLLKTTNTIYQHTNGKITLANPGLMGNTLFSFSCARTTCNPP